MKMQFSINPSNVYSLLFCGLLACNTNNKTSENSTQVDETTTTQATTTETSAVESTDENTGSETGGNSSNQCHATLQDCPTGEKCVPIQENVSNFPVPDATVCKPEAVNPAKIGDECTVEVRFGSGIDNCEKGSFCLDMDYDGKATCVAFCKGHPDSPSCEKPDEKCVELFAVELQICFPTCDPLIQDCPPQDNCTMDDTSQNSGFVCMPRYEPTAPGGGAYPDYCNFMTQCQQGNACNLPQNFPQGVCKSIIGCCTPWCDITEDPDPCKDFDPLISCVPWFEEGLAPPNYENVGICSLPNSGP